MHLEAVEEIALPRIDGWDRWVDRSFRALASAAALVVALTLLGVLFQLFAAAWPTLKTHGLAPMASAKWDVNAEEFGILPEIWGTVITAFLALGGATVFGVLIAVFLSQQFLPPRLANFLRNLVDLLAAVPSVVYGLWGIYVLIPLLRGPANWLHETFTWMPLFATPFTGPSLLPAALVLAIMVLPTIASLSRDALASVPKNLRDGALALGASKWEAIIRVVIPTALPGLLGATVLGLGRALGETMAVAMLVGNTPKIGVNLLQPANTLSTLLANNFPEAPMGSSYAGALTLAALTLLVIALTVNVAGALITQRATRWHRGGR